MPKVLLQNKYSLGKKPDCRQEKQSHSTWTWMSGTAQHTHAHHHQVGEFCVVLKPYTQERNTKLHNAKSARIVIKTPGCLTMMMCICLVHGLSHVHNIWINYACQEGALLSTPALTRVMCPLCNQWSVVMCPAQELAPIHQLFHLFLSHNLVQDLSLLHAPEVSPLS